MSRKATCLIAVAVLGAVSGAARAQITVDGHIDSSEYGAPLATQSTATGWGDNTNELDALYGQFSGGALNLGVTGNLEGTGNGLIIFLDTQSGGGIANTAGGGYNQFGSIGGQRVDDWGTDTDGSDAVSPTPGGGSIVNAGFNPEKAIEMNYYAAGNAYYINIIDLTQPNDDTHPNKDIYLGQNAPGPTSVTQYYFRDYGSTYAGSITHAFDDSNTAGITGDPNALGDATTANTGFELGMDSDFIQHEPGKAVRVMAFISNTDGSYLSNQFLPALHYADSGDLGGAGGWGGDPLVDVRNDAFSGDMFITLFEPSFTAGGDNNWSTAANWAGNFAPNGVEHDAAFSGSGGAVNLDEDVTLGTLKFNGSAGYEISTAASHTLTMNAGSGASRIDVLGYSNQIHPQVTFATDTRINTAVADVTFDSVVNPGKAVTVAGIGTVTFNAQNNAAGSIMAVDSGNVVFNQDAGASGANLKLYASGTVTFKSQQNLDELGVNAGGRVRMADRATIGPGTHPLYTNTLTIADDGSGNPTGTLDMNDSDLVVNNGDFSTIQNLVFAGYRSSPDSTATGIISSTSQATGGKTILALFDNALVGDTSWDGHTVSSTAVIGKYTYYGDVNLDGQVTGDDYSAVDSNLGSTGLNPGNAWLMGDTNGDLSVTGDDYASIDANLGLGAGSPLAVSSVSAVPEPASLGMLALGGIALLRRRRPR